jgi:hypothetical protein
MSRYASSDQAPEVLESRNEEFFNSITIVKDESTKKKSKTSKAKKA